MGAGAFGGEKVVPAREEQEALEDGGHAEEAPGPWMRAWGRRPCWEARGGGRLGGSGLAGEACGGGRAVDAHVGGSLAGRRVAAPGLVGAQGKKVVFRWVGSG